MTKELVMTKVELTNMDIAQLVELLQEYRNGVVNGERIPNQSSEDELADTDELLDKLRATQR